MSTLAQGVFKCMVDGKAVYQASPCASGGKELTIPSGPSEQAAKEARSRAAAEKARVTGSAAVSSKSPPVARKQATTKPVDCDALKKRRAFAYGERNAAVRRTTNPAGGFRNEKDEKRNDAIVDRAMAEIKRLESQMAAAGCPLD